MLGLGAAAYFAYRAYVLAGLLADQVDYTDEVEQLSEYMYRMIDEAHRNISELIDLVHLKKKMKQAQHFNY